MHLKKAMRLLATPLLLASVSAEAWSNSMRYDMTPGVTDISREVYDLHQTILWICVVIGGLVFALMFWAMLHHRKSRGVKPATFHESTKVEIIWTAIPFFILVAMAWPATSTLIKMEDPSNADLTILVTGYQWKWRYEYMDYEGKNIGLSYFSNLATSQNQITNTERKSDNYLLEVDRPLYIPTGKKVRFLVTANDVIHSWWVPDFAVKKDAIPGFINETWTKVDQPGTYRGQCAELCGKDHGFMPIVVIAQPQAEFDDWIAKEQAIVAEQKKAEYEAYGKEWTLDELMAKGESVYNAKCAACHAANGEGIPGVFPAMKGSALILSGVKPHIDIVVNGKSGSAMQAFRDQLNDIETAAVITYERNAWGNNTGDVVQPRDIRDFKAGN